MAHAAAAENTNNGASTATWDIAKSILTAKDLERLACCYFYSDHTKVDYESAATAFGSASANSFRTMLSATVKKVRDAEGNGGVPLASPAKSRGGGGGGGKKRKADADNVEDDGRAVAKAPAKKRGSSAAAKKAKAMKEVAAADASDGDEEVAAVAAGNEAVKEEEDESEE